MVNLLILAAAEETGGISTLGIDPLAILAQATTFLLLFWIIKRFALTKIIATLEKRRQTISEGVELGLEMRQEQEKLNERIEQKLAEARAEADKIIAGGHEEAGAVIKEAEAKATAKFNTMLADASSRIDEETKHAKKALEQEVLDLITRATELVVEEKLTSQKDNELIKRSLEKAEING